MKITLQRNNHGARLSRATATREDQSTSGSEPPLRGAGLREKRPGRAVALLSTCVLLAMGAFFTSSCLKAPMRTTALPGQASRAAVIPGALPSAGEEVWVIARSSKAAAQTSDNRPGSGALYTEVEHQQVAVPLKHTDVKAGISGYRPATI